jgi:tetratricopeptide (TPR) repeat protein
MESGYDPWDEGAHIRMRDDFIRGLKCFSNQDFEAALALFRAADEEAEFDDIYQNRYTSYHGLTRVLLADSFGVKLCRKAAVGETGDATVYFNLAQAEDKLGNRESAVTAMRHGLRIDPGHHGLRQLHTRFQSQQPRAVIPGLSCDHVLNRFLGKLLGGKVKPGPVMR